ncbi:von Willebrand factor type A domain-containing protein [Pseudonocardia hierapolitana]|uniref:von Willebrand factor type A domain-containing protein n=1 Tax=Pseudonocardia hierapolitana TaxID=1128676 RepID=A0A561T2B9_9PSEU|nr:VWA domain-containing protein [Pseudonocardia hierapolitana]TWF81252.1 von Willebrand factor type A domain-containing protein [Pseudonocardia hierapolitana]
MADGAASGAGAFTVDVDQNSYLPVDATRVDAIVTVTAADGAAGPAPASEVLEVIVVDCSTSMTGSKIRAARQATVAAIAELRDGVSFAVVAGNHVTRQVFPTHGTAVADAGSRAAATRLVERLQAEGGTGIGNWLTHVGGLAREHPGSIKHAILLTDGQNGESPEYFSNALNGALGAFTCDCRGVGTDWRVDELRTIATAMLGTVDIVADPADLAADFRSIMGEAMGKSVADLALRLWTPRGASVRFVKQVAPAVEDLTDRRTEAARQSGDYPLGSWGAESRDYHLAIEVPQGAVGDEMLAGRVSIVRPGSGDTPEQVLGQGLVKAIWTEDTALSTRISRGVAHYTGQAELAEAIQEGLAARKAGDEVTATARLGRAVALAAASGNEGTARLLGRVVEVVDAPSGTVRLRRVVADVDEMTLDTRSTRTVRVRGDG